MEETDKEEKMRLLQAGLAKVKQQFIDSLPGRVEELDALMDALYDEERDLRDVIEGICQRAHKLHGQAGAFGFAELGQTAAKLEHACMAVLEGSPEADTEEVETYLGALLDMIDESLEAA